MGRVQAGFEVSEAGLDDVGNVNDDDVDDMAGNDVDDMAGNDVDDMAGNRVDDMVGNRVEGGGARAVLDYIARSLAAEPDAVLVETDESSRGVRFRIHVAPGDMGRMIGRRGRVAQAIRTVVRVAGSREGVDTNVDFVDD
ncbi:MAG TPA: KH domain-containing protein [Acidimicrobiales bacterium]|nr:KH domain-containing protein [Acidimicrobiales bacterium]